MIWEDDNQCWMIRVGKQGLVASLVILSRNIETKTGGNQGSVTATIGTPDILFEKLRWFLFRTSGLAVCEVLMYVEPL